MYYRPNDGKVLTTD